MAHSDLAIRRKASYLLHETSQYHLKTDIEEVARYLEIDVLYKDLEDETSGFLLLKDGAASAVINVNHHGNRQRFTLAHEVGHFCLHVNRSRSEDLFVDKKVFNRNTNSSKGEITIEIEANKFAAHLLMPKDRLYSVISRNYKGMDLEEDRTHKKLAHDFGVSMAALSNRLRALELISKY